jgi:FkbM family methyltransferase
MLEPVTIDPSELHLWQTGAAQPVPWRIAYLLSRVMPRGKGWFPRVIGRSIGRGMRTTIRTRGGGVVAVDPPNLDVYVTVAKHGGVGEHQIHDALIAVVRPGDVVFDIGANAGIVSVDTLANMKGAIQLVAFEPIPSLAHAAALSGALSGYSDCLRVYEVMLGREEGETSLFVPRHSIHASAKAREAGSVELKRPVYTLDGLVTSGVLPEPDVIKIDVEGGELGVFAGGAEMLRRKQPTIIFEADENMERFGYTREDLLEMLRSYAPYLFMYVTTHGLVPMDGREKVSGDDANNMLAVTPGRPLSV